MRKLISFLAVGSMVFSFALVNVALADSTIGVNISTTGTLTVNSGSATAIQFQNGSGTNVFIFDTSKKKFGIGATPGTTFEAQGTASASYFLTGNTIQIGGYASVAYSRFGTGATGHGLSANNDLLITGFTEFDKKAYFDATASAAYFFSQNAAQFAGNASVAYSRFGTTATGHANYISASNDLLVSGDVEIRGSVSFGSTASVSGIFYMNDGRFRPNSNSATAFRFQNTAGTIDVLTIDTTNTRIGVGATPGTTFEAQGTASASYFLTGNTIQIGGYASVAYSRFGTGATGHGLSANNDLLITGFTEFDKKAYFDATASAAYFFSQNAAQFAGNASVAYSRFGTTATGHANYISASNDLLVSGDVEIKGTASFGGVASVATNFNVGENSTATTSVTFETRSTTTGVCFILTGTNGTVYYARVVASGSTGVAPKLWINTINCNQ